SSDLAALVDHLVDDRDRRFGQDRHARHHDLELVLAELVDGQEGLVLPAQEDVADISLHEGDGGAARPGIEYGYVAVELLHIIAGGIAAASGLAFGIAPGGEIVPARAAGGLRIRRDDLDVILYQIFPVADVFRVALAHQKHDGREIRGRIVGQACLPVPRD